MADPRLTPVRPDLAARYLQGQVNAERFADGERREIAVPVTPMRRTPSPEAPLETEALFGEHAVIYEFTDEGWAWGQLESDGYVGWLPSAMLRLPGAAATHRVSAPRTFAFPGPSIKMPPLATLPMNARLAAAREIDGFLVTPEGWHVPRQHVVIATGIESDFVGVAEWFAGTPYLWGGRTALGLDCSGLVQTALAACGVRSPRDSDMQEAGLGTALPRNEWRKLQRGDLIFWKGHVAILRDTATIIHANAHHMMATTEPLDEAIARIAATGSDVTSIKRL